MKTRLRDYAFVIFASYGGLLMWAIDGALPIVGGIYGYLKWGVWGAIGGGLAGGAIAAVLAIVYMLIYSAAMDSVMKGDDPPPP